MCTPIATHWQYVALALSIFISGQAKSSSQAQVTSLVSIELESQSLTTALIALGRDAQVNVLFSASNTANIRSKKIAGTLPLEDIVAELLRGTELTFRFLDPRTVIIEKIHADLNTAKIDENNIATQPSEQIAGQAGDLSQVSTKEEHLSEQEDFSSQVIQGFDGLERIVITGSRLKRGGKNANVPITLIDPSYMTFSG